jgi:fibronectin type 3 domain-containing protein
LTIQAGKSASLNVTFKPPSSGNKSATLTFAGNASNSPASEALSGTGAAVTTKHSVTLSWNASTSKVTGYNVYRSMSSSGNYVKLNSSLSATTTYTDTTVASGSTYFYATTAVNSNQVKVAVP